MTAPEKRARNLVRSLTTAQLLDQWELTTGLHTPETAMVRGWLMDEIEKRNPEAFDAWLDADDPRDEELRNYMCA